MPRKKTTPAAKPDAILPDGLLEKLIPGPMDAAGVEAVFQKLKRAVIERALGASILPGIAFMRIPSSREPFSGSSDHRRPCGRPRPHRAPGGDG